MSVKKILTTFLFLTVFSTSFSAFADDKEDIKNGMKVIECAKLSGSIFIMGIIAGVPQELAGRMADKKISDCIQDGDAKKTILFVQGLVREYLLWRDALVECAFIIGKQTTKSQTINNSIIKEYEMEKINKCAAELVEVRRSKNTSL